VVRSIGCALHGGVAATNNPGRDTPSWSNPISYRWSTWLVAPTSTSARAASFRPEVEIGGNVTRVLAEQTAAVDPSRLGKSVGYLSLEEMRRVDAALRTVLDL
jgi:mRNA interferase MazF